MKFSILGFNQEKVVELGLSIKHLHILSYIYEAIASPSMQHIVLDDVAYVWLQHTKLLEDLPILDIGERALVKYLSELKELGLIQTKNIANTSLQGSKCYYAITLKCEELRYTTDTQKNACLIRDAKKCVSNNQLIDNKLNTDNTNVLSTENSVECSNDGFLTYEVKEPQPKPKKKNLYTNCMDLIDDFTESEEVKNLLKDYLKVRLERKDKPFGINTFRGMLKKLRTLTDSKEECLKIIQQSIDLSYPSFFPLSKPKYKQGCPELIEQKNNKGITEEELKEAIELGEKF